MYINNNTNYKKNNQGFPDFFDSKSLIFDFEKPYSFLQKKLIE